MKTDSTVKRQMDAKIEAKMAEFPKHDRVYAAEELLNAQPGWYKQTPEGEYLLQVIKDSETECDGVDCGVQDCPECCLHEESECLICNNCGKELA